MDIYVGNLSYQVREEEINTMFASYGQVDLVKLVKDRETGNSKGFAFVEMSNAEEANAAIEGLNGKEISGRKVVVSEARPKEDRPARRPGMGAGRPQRSFSSPRSGERGSDRGGRRF